MNHQKLCIASAQPAIAIPAAALSEASEKPLRRPIRRIRRVAGTADAAMQTIMTDTGKVASVGSSASSEPMMPPSVTMMMAPVAEMS